MGNLNGRVTRLERRVWLDPLEHVRTLPDAALEAILADCTPEQRAYLESLTDAELEAIAQGKRP